MGSSLHSHSLYGERRANRKSRSGKCKKLYLRREPEPDSFLHLCSTRRASAGTSELIFCWNKKLRIWFLFWKSSPGAPNGKINSCGLKRLRCELNSTAWPPSGCPLCLTLVHADSRVITYFRISVTLRTAQPPVCCASRLETASSQTASC